MTKDAVLKCLGRGKKTAQQLAERLGVPRLRVYRRLSALLIEGEVLIAGSYLGEKRRGPRARLYEVAR